MVKQAAGGKRPPKTISTEKGQLPMLMGFGWGGGNAAEVDQLRTGDAVSQISPSLADGREKLRQGHSGGVDQKEASQILAGGNSQTKLAARDAPRKIPGWGL
jgi:hypothetical protein